MFKLSIETDNAAFDEQPDDEVIRILKETIEYLQGGLNEHPLHDINGNKVGAYKLTRGKK